MGEDSDKRATPHSDKKSAALNRLQRRLHRRKIARIQKANKICLAFCILLGLSMIPISINGYQQTKAKNTAALKAKEQMAANPTQEIKDTKPLIVGSKSLIKRHSSILPQYMPIVQKTHEKE